ncbi:MAG: hypothetical protein JXC85_01510 [Candidatus Aenigmarchaeota archaeon]|nr:hypothetical protein [Candidatus Aenigmarchaeota archaeon]
MSVWKTKDETYHGTKWGYAVVALVIIVVLSLLGSIFYLIGEGIKTVQLDPVSVIAWIAVIIVIVIVLIIMGWALSPVYNFFAGLWNVIWTLFSNVYLLVVVIIIAAVFISMISIYAMGESPISLQNPLMIALLIGLLIVIMPFAIFLIDLFSYEHE